MKEKIERPKETKSRAVANPCVQGKDIVKQCLMIEDNRPEVIGQRKFLNIVDKNSRIEKPLTFQPIKSIDTSSFAQSKKQESILGSKSATEDIELIQRYTTNKDGEMVSSQKNLVLESDGSKEFYATDVGFEKNKKALISGKVENIEFTKGAAKKYSELGERVYSKVVPVFKNVEDTRMKSEVNLETERTQAQAQIPAWYDPFWLWARLVNIGSGYQPRFYQEYMRSIAGNQSKVDEIGREINFRQTKNEFIDTAINALSQVLNRVNENSDEEIADISFFFAQPPGVQNVIEKSTMHFIQTNWSKQSNKRVRDGLRHNINRRLAELDAQNDNPNTPYLPTDCQNLKNYLKGKDAQKIDSKNKGIKPKVGDYYYIDYSKRDDNGPWPYHFGTILFKDGADTVTLEDAAGQGTAREINHWYFMMYGTKGKQTFKEKTDQEYLRRLKIKP